ncbi:MAG: hypothetical protein F4Y88_01420, partial [Chloroflexi bacterium]|nr:hypothetical protein [Chloroflexota bacterium]
MSFRKAAEENASGDRNPLDLSRALRVRLSDLCFTDFFVDGTRRWRMQPPTLGRLASHRDTAAFYGSRTPTLVDALQIAARVYGARIATEMLPDCPTSFRVTGEEQIFSAIANRIGAVYKPNDGTTIAESVSPIHFVLNNATTEPAPLNWTARCFDFDKRAWVDVLSQNAAWEFTPTYGSPKYYVRRRSRKLLRMSKRESLYAAAMLNGLRLIKYEMDARQLSVPLFAPLPELYARAACLCSCRPAQVVDGRLVYCDVTPEVAALLMVSAGQPHPGVTS